MSQLEPYLDVFSKLCPVITLTTRRTKKNLYSSLFMKLNCFQEPLTFTNKTTNLVQPYNEVLKLQFLNTTLAINYTRTSYVERRK